MDRLASSAPGFAAGGHGYNNIHRNPVNVEGGKQAFVFTWQMAVALFCVCFAAYKGPTVVSSFAFGQLQLQQFTGEGELTTKILRTVEEVKEQMTKMGKKQEECCKSDAGNAGDDQNDQSKDKHTAIPETDWLQKWLQNCFGSWAHVVLVLCGVVLSAVLNNLQHVLRVVFWVVSQVTKCAIWCWNSEWAKAVSSWLLEKKEQQAVALPEIRVSNVVMQTPAAAQQDVPVAAANEGGNVAIDTPALRTPRFPLPTTRLRLRQTEGGK